METQSMEINVSYSVFDIILLTLGVVVEKIFNTDGPRLVLLSGKEVPKNAGKC